MRTVHSPDAHVFVKSPEAGVHTRENFFYTFVNGIVKIKKERIKNK